MVSKAFLLHPMIASNLSLSQHSDSIDTLDTELYSPMLYVGGVMRSRPPADGGTRAQRSLSIAIRRDEHGKDLFDTSAAAMLHFTPGLLYLYPCSFRESCFSVVFKDRLPAWLQRCQRTRLALKSAGTRQADYDGFRCQKCTPKLRAQLTCVPVAALWS